MTSYENRGNSVRTNGSNFLYLTENQRTGQHWVQGAGGLPSVSSTKEASQSGFRSKRAASQHSDVASLHSGFQQKLWKNCGRKRLITNKFGVENPYQTLADTNKGKQATASMQVANPKVQRQYKSLERQAEKQAVNMRRIKLMSRRLSLYKKYHQQYGIKLSKYEREKLLRADEHEQVELMMVRKLFNIREVAAATRIQIWWKKIKAFKLARIISQLRHLAAAKI